MYCMSYSCSKSVLRIIKKQILIKQFPTIFQSVQIYLLSHWKVNNPPSPKIVCNVDLILLSLHHHSHLLPAYECSTFQPTYTLSPTGAVYAYAVAPPELIELETRGKFIIQFYMQPGWTGNV